MVAVAGLIWHREIVMDIKDRDGDALVGVRTVPVAFGRDVALGFSLVPLVVAAATAASACTRGGAIAGASLVIQGVLAMRSRTLNYSRESLGVAIELAPLWLLASLISLTI